MKDGANQNVKIERSIENKYTVAHVQYLPPDQWN